MIKMTRVYGDMYVPREYCTFTNPVTSGGTEEVDYVDMETPIPMCRWMITHFRGHSEVQTCFTGHSTTRM